MEAYLAKKSSFTAEVETALKKHQLKDRWAGCMKQIEDDDYEENLNTTERRYQRDKESDD